VDGTSLIADLEEGGHLRGGGSVTQPDQYERFYLSNGQLILYSNGFIANNGGVTGNFIKIVLNSQSLISSNGYTPLSCSINAVSNELTCFVGSNNGRLLCADFFYLGTPGNKGACNNLVLTAVYI
jgi:hypothetical protein